MRRLVLLLFSIFWFTHSLFAQYYHYNKGEKFLSIGWDDSAFSEYVSGMNAGEPSSAMMVAWCYLNERGTPRNVQKALSILDQWSKKDPSVCLFTAIFYDQTKCAGKVVWGGDEFFMQKAARIYAPSGEGIYSSGIWSIYDREPIFAEDYGVSFDIEKAIKYAEILNKKVNSKSTNDYVYLLKNGKIGQSGDKIAVFAAFNPEVSRNINEYYRVVEDAFEQCHSLEEIGILLDLEREKRHEIKSLNSNYFLNSWEKRCYEELSEKSLFFYKELHNKYCVDEKSLNDLKEIYNNNYHIKSAIDIGLSIAAQMKGYLDNDVNEVLWICNNVPFERSRDTARLVWTRCKLVEDILNFSDWDSIEAIYSSPNYFEKAGSVPFKEGDLYGLLKCYVEIDSLTVLVKNENGSFSYNHRELSFAEAELRNKRNQMKDKNWAKLSTKKNDIYLYKKFAQERLVNRIKQREKIGGIPYWRMLSLFALGEKTPAKEVLNTLLSVYGEDISLLDTVYCDNASFNSFREDILDQKSFSEFLLKEITGNLQFDNYLEFGNSKSKYRMYATNKLEQFRKERQLREKMVQEMNGISKQDIKNHDAFISACQSCARKKINMETLETVKNNVIMLALKQCGEAYSIYPDEVSPIQKQYEEELDVVDIIEAYANTYDALVLAEAFLKKYPGSLYTNLITDYYNDSYAIRMANQLTTQSSQEDINCVLALPMTKDGKKKVKELSSKSYLKNKKNF